MRIVNQSHLLIVERLRPDKSTWDYENHYFFFTIAQPCDSHSNKWQNLCFNKSVDVANFAMEMITKWQWSSDRKIFVGAMIHFEPKHLHCLCFHMGHKVYEGVLGRIKMFVADVCPLITAKLVHWLNNSISDSYTTNKTKGNFIFQSLEQSLVIRHEMTETNVAFSINIRIHWARWSHPFTGHALNYNCTK